MRRLFSLRTLGIICMAGFLMATPQLFAQDDEFGVTDGGGAEEQEAAAKKDPPESEVIEDLCKKMCSDGDEKIPHRLNYDSVKKTWTAIVEIPDRDPFKPIVEKKVVLPPVRKVQEVKPVEKDKKPVAPPIKPIKLFVSGIVGNEGSRLAIVKFENEEMTITKDQIVEGKFKVVDIYADRVVVYSNKEQRRHTFKIGGEDAKD